MTLQEWICFAAVLSAGGLCYAAGWTGRARWSAVAVLISVLQFVVSRSGVCLVAILVVSLLCGLAGRFDRRR